MKTFFFLIIILLSGCSVKRNVFHDPHFFYDKENYTIIRVNPETRDEVIKRYYEGLKKTIVGYIPPKPDLHSIPYDTPPRPKKIVRPNYPDDAKKMGCQGLIILQLLVDSTGIVKKALTLNFLSYKEYPEVFQNRIHYLKIPKNSQITDNKFNEFEELLIEASLEAAIQTEFEPAYKKGNPAKVWVSFPVHFILKKDQELENK